METTCEAWDRMLRREGHWKVEIKVPILAIRDWWINRQRKKREKRQAIYFYFYECGCEAIQGPYYNPPYCPRHGMYLRCKPLEKKGE